MALDNYTNCHRCSALVERGTWMREHLLWHARLENLEEPSSDFGFWDRNGRWTANSREWT